MLQGLKTENELNLSLKITKKTTLCFSVRMLFFKKVINWLQNLFFHHCVISRKYRLNRNIFQ